MQFELTCRLMKHLHAINNAVVFEKQSNNLETVKLGIREQASESFERLSFVLPGVKLRKLPDMDSKGLSNYSGCDAYALATSQRHQVRRQHEGNCRPAVFELVDGDAANMLQVEHRCS